MKKYLASILTLAFLALFAWYGLTHREIFNSLTRVAWWSLVLIAVLKLVKFYSNGLFVKYTAEAFTRKFTAKEGIYVSIISALGNFFGPFLGGLGMRAVYLKRVHNLPVSKFTATLIGYYLMMFMVNSLLAVVALLFLPQTHQTVYAVIFFAAWFLAFLGLAFVRLPSEDKLGLITRNKIGKLIYKVLADIESGWRVMLADKKLLAQMFGLAVLSWVCVYFISLVEFQALGIKIGLPSLALYTALVQVSLILAFTPDGVGVRELLLILLGSTINITNGQIVQIGIIDRGVHFILLGFLFLLIRNGAIKRTLTGSKAEQSAS